MPLPNAGPDLEDDMPEPIEVSETTWDEFRVAGFGRFLGRVVWPLQDDRPGSP